jgi:hypothetical protein
MPEEVCDPAGGMIRRNPGVTLLWHTHTYTVYRTSADPTHNIGAGFLIEIGEPTGVDWYKEGRKATRDEVLESIRTGLPCVRPSEDCTARLDAGNGSLCENCFDSSVTSWLADFRSKLPVDKCIR